MSRQVAAAALLILLFAAFFRYLSIGDLPAGLQHDETAYAVDAVDVMHGARQVFFERSNGREPLFIYLVGGSFSVFGVGVWQMRIVSASIGLLTVAALFRLAFDLFGSRIGLFAMAFIAFGYWPLHVSHTAFRAVTLPLFMTLSALTLWRAVRGRGMLSFAVAGLFFGATMYTYLSNRMLPVLFVAWLLIYVAVVRRTKDLSGGPARNALAGVAVFLAVWTLVFAPLGWYFWTHQDAFLLRSVQVNDFRPIIQDGDFRPLLTDTANTLGMFVIHGDDSWKYNLSGRPVFDLLSGAYFLVGLGLLLYRSFARRVGPIDKILALGLLAWIAVMLVPGAISGESPHFLRTIGAQPAIFLIPALGLDRLLALRVLPVRAIASVSLVTFGSYGSLSAYDVFVRWAGSAEQQAFFRADYREAFAAVSRGIASPIAVGAEYPYDLDPMTMSIIAGRTLEARWFDGQRSQLRPAAGGLILTPRFAEPPGMPAVNEVSIQGKWGQIDSVESASLDLPGNGPASPRFGDALTLTGQQAPAAIRAGEVLTVPLSWQSTGDTIPGDISFSVKLVGPWDSVWAQDDLSPVPPADLRSGDRFTVFHRLEIDPAVAPGIYRLTLQVYRRSNLSVLQVSNAGPSGSPDHFELGRLAIERATPDALRKVTPRFPLEATFGDSATLLGFDLDKPVAAAGESLGLTVYWRADKGGLPDLTTFVHLLHDGEPDKLWGQRDSQPVFGAFPTTDWRQGDVIKDRYDIAIDPAAPAGSYHIAIGLYLRDGGERLPLTPPKLSPQDRLTELLAKIGLPYRPSRVEADRVLLRRNVIERR